MKAEAVSACHVLSRDCLEPSSTFRGRVIRPSILQVHNESSIIGALGELSTARRCHALRRDAPSHESSQVVTERAKIFWNKLLSLCLG